MKLEEQVVSLELAKKIKELGFEQESLFYWELNNSEYTLSYKKKYVHEILFPISAYTVAELGKFLTKDTKAGFDIEYSSTAWNPIWKKWQAFAVDGNNEEYHSEEAQTEADARGKMLIYLIENNLKAL